MVTSIYFFKYSNYCDSLVSIFSVDTQMEGKKKKKKKNVEKLGKKLLNENCNMVNPLVFFVGIDKLDLQTAECSLSSIIIYRIWK